MGDGSIKPIEEVEAGRRGAVAATAAATSGLRGVTRTLPRSKRRRGSRITTARRPGASSRTPEHTHFAGFRRRPHAADAHDLPDVAPRQGLPRSEPRRARTDDRRRARPACALGPGRSEPMPRGSYRCTTTRAEARAAEAQLALQLRDPDAAVRRAASGTAANARGRPGPLIDRGLRERRHRAGRPSAPARCGSQLDHAAPRAAHGFEGRAGTRHDHAVRRSARRARPMPHASRSAGATREARARARGRWTAPSSPAQGPDRRAGATSRCFSDYGGRADDRRARSGAALPCPVRRMARLGSPASGRGTRCRS